MAEVDRFGARPSWGAPIVGAILGLIGLVLGVGGAWLASLSGSLYYLLAGVALVVSGVLLIRRQALGAWIYGATFAATLVWAFWEVGPWPWPLMPRVLGPFILLLAVIAVSPGLRGARHSRKAAWAAIAACALLFVAAGVVIARGDRPVVMAALPPVDAAASFPDSGGDWIAYGGTYAAQRYSTLAQINTDNVGRLERAWVAHTRDLPKEMKDHKYGAETTPLKVGDRLYLCSAKNILIALDAATGRERWRFDPKVPDDNIPYTAACRGVSYYAVPGADPRAVCATRIIEGTLDARLIAVDARTGRLCSGFGTNGQVDITLGLGRVVPGMVSITSPPTIVRGVIVTGHQVLDGERNDAPSGVVQGFDAATGEQRWAWDMARPADAPLGPNETYTRGTPNMWTIASGDEALGLVYLPMGNSAVDYWSSDRSPQENFFATSLVALDAASGRPRWRFQTVHKDVWDYDLGSQATLIDLPGGVPALILPSKQGDIYILDRRTGRPLSRIGEMRVPQGGVEPQQRTPTQPVSLYHTLRKRDLIEADMWGMSPIDQMICRIQFRRADYRGFYTPPTSDGRWIQYPGYNGGSDWGGIAVDPRRGIIVANYNDMPNYNRLVPREAALEKGWYPRGEEPSGKLGDIPRNAGDPQAGTPYAIHVNAGWRLPLTQLMCKAPPYGGIRAIEIATGRTIWDRPFGSARRNGPWKIPSMLPFTIGTPNNGGGVITAGGLMFIAATTDNLFRAIDLRTGETLWRDVLPAGGQATPMTYEAGGRQYVVIMAGGHHFMETPVGDALIAYALPR